MTSEEILDGNKLIAEFMGLPKYKIEFEGKVLGFSKSKYNTYDKNWNNLMPVIGKITSECEEPEELDNLRLHIITNDILYAWKFVVNYLSDKQ